jgi:hypothetical protein
MFIIKFLGLMDFLACLVLGLTMIGVIPFRIVFAFALYLFVKGYVFKGDFLSFVDMLAAFVMLIIYFVGIVSGFFVTLSIIIILLFLYKSFFSFVTI